MEKQLYPSWRFHATLPPCIVNTPEEAAELGDGWEQSPAAFADQPSAPAEENGSGDPKSPKKTSKNKPKE